MSDNKPVLGIPVSIATVENKLVKCATLKCKQTIPMDLKYCGVCSCSYKGCNNKRLTSYSCCSQHWDNELMEKVKRHEGLI